jgi:hypothetical protein
VRLLHARFAESLLREAAPQRAALKSGSTVAHLAFYLAQHVGCDPIILLGQDLGFSDGLYYPPGTPIERVWGPELGRFQTVEMKQWERIVRGRPILRTVQDVRGGDMYTDEQLLSYAEQFESDFAACPSRIIHAGETGMRLRGTTVMSLADAATAYCTRPLPADWMPADGPVTDAGALPRAVAALEARRAEVAALRGVAAEMLPLLKELAQRVRDPAAFNRLLLRVDDLRARIRQYERTYNLVVDISQRAELQRHSADRRLGECESETPATAAARLRRDYDFVAAFLDGCTYLEELLPEALGRLRYAHTPQALERNASRSLAVASAARSAVESAERGT